MAKKTDFKKEKERLAQVFSEVPPEKLEVASELLDRITFMTITLKKLEDIINKEGPIVLFVNGKQEMMIENPAQKSYNTMINRYTTAFDKLVNLLPKDAPKVDDSLGEFATFLNERSD